MAWITPFIVLIERRLLRPVWLMLLATVVLVTGIGAHASKPGKARKLARDLEVAINSPVQPGERWVRQRGGRRMVDAIIVSSAADRTMADLRAHVERLGGTVNAAFSSVQGLSVTVPTRAVAELDARDDVVSISPNRTTRHTFSTLETTTGATSSQVRPYSSAVNYTGLDGKGIGIAVLDSGVMAGHKHLANGLVGSRVVRQVNMVGQGASLSWAMSLPPGSAERNLYETSVNNNLAAVPDGYGHGTHVAAIAAGKGSYRALDTSGIAPGASIIDVKVLADDGSGNMADVIAGLDWVLYNARQYNIRIVNLSLSAGSTTTWVLDPLAQAARAVASTGIVVVTSAGNYGQIGGKTTMGTIGSPGHDPSVITVGASNMKITPARGDDVVTNFSSRGPTRGALVMSNGQRVIDNLRDGCDLRAHLGADVALDEVVDLVEPHEVADCPVGEVHRRVDEQLLGKLDDGAVRTADVLAGTALGSQAGDDLDDKVDLVRKQRVEVDEGLARHLGELDVGGEPRVLGESAAVLVEELPERGLCACVLREHAAARDLGDVARLQVNLQRESVHQAGQLDFLVVEAGDKLAELLLGGDDDPVLAAPLHAELLHDCLQIEHLLDVAGDELTDLVDHEHEREPRLAALHEFAGALGELARRDVCLVLDRLHPGIGNGVRVGIHGVEHATRLGEGEGNLALLAGPLLFEQTLVRVLEGLKLPLLLEANLQL